MYNIAVAILLLTSCIYQSLYIHVIALIIIKQQVAIAMYLLWSFV